MTDTATHVDMTRHADRVIDVPGTTNLEMIADQLGAIDPGTVTLKCDTRTGFDVVFSLRLDGAQLVAWRRGAKDDLAPSGYDEFQWRRVILAAQCVEIRKNGVKVVEQSTGIPVTFRSPEFQRLLKVPQGSPSGSVEAVRKFYANDFAVTAAAEKVIELAGMGKDAEVVVNPTPGPSSF
jgi:hypothetical protein